MLPLSLKVFIVSVLMFFTRALMRHDFSFKLDFDYGFGRDGFDTLSVLAVATLALSLILLAIGL
ncbi:MAG TPA: hypothetical protein VHC20_02065 [Candidatus Paceibacterota bacterium]|nr:hypothetical protein [Candidatus Paceibacterota bacterium]